jgi:hypothetical protein
MLQVLASSPRQNGGTGGRGATSFPVPATLRYRDAALPRRCATATLRYGEVVRGRGPPAPHRHIVPAFARVRHVHSLGAWSRSADSHQRERASSDATTKQLTASDCQRLPTGDYACVGSAGRVRRR